MLTIGLTGGIGSGKSTVSDIFQSLGVPVIDSDLIAREVVQPGEPGLKGIIQHFGTGILQPDGSLDRQRLRNLVFDDETARKHLEQILHPLIRQRSQQRMATLNTPYAILAIPLLVETGLADSVDRVLVVDCPESVQIERICSRDGINPDQAQAILAAQCSRKQRLEAADDIIDNDQSID
ncbi:MAG: dephospho-CoA kinase, partial [Gammaproteobacteria bacterium]|nr:dephospho-CoA kinase [Gammaproteobacteria bacterium]